MTRSAHPAGDAKRVPVWTWGDRVRKARRDLGLTQAEFAELTGYTDKAIAAWESGRNTPNVAVISLVLERATGIDRLWWIGWTDESPPPNGPFAVGSTRSTTGRRTKRRPTNPCLSDSYRTVSPWVTPTPIRRAA